MSGDDCLPVCLDLDDDRWDKYFMANIAGAQECNNEDEEGRSDIESDKEDQTDISQLKSFKEAIEKYIAIKRDLNTTRMKEHLVYSLVDLF